MKELSIREKAHLYDEAIERANELLYVSDRDSLQRKTVEHIFPELKESEDELHRKWILEYLYNGLRKSDEQFKDHFKAAIAWLEKQGEHANFRNKIQIGDKVTRNEDGVLVNLSQLNRVAKKDEKQGENNMGISEATKKKLEDNLNKALEKETPESCNEFLDEQSEQKPWSKEDEKMLECAIDMIEWYSVVNKSKSKLVSDWLKSLKERYAWKPSEEQMDALRYVTNFDYGGYKAALVSLYEQLKKLKE